jgi:hypothetical protein
MRLRDSSWFDNDIPLLWKSVAGVSCAMSRVLKHRFIAAASLGCVGIALGIASAFGLTSGPAYVGLAPTGALPAAAVKTLQAELEEGRQALKILPEQDAAWQRYVTVMTSLERERRDFDDRVSRGAVKDNGTEYWRHQFVLIDAINELFTHLSPAQVERARPLAQLFAASSICRGLQHD